MTDILEILNSLNIEFQLQEHKAIFSEKDSREVEILLPGIEVKNLFVKDKKSNYALVTLALHERADLKKIALELGFERLSFCSAQELLSFLNITPGSVTPFCIMFDTERKVKFLLDENLKGKNVIVHPLRNTASVSISCSDLERFIEHYNHKVMTGSVCLL